MPGFLKRIRTSTSERLDRAAVGSSQPAGTEPVPAEDARKPSARERGQMRRRLRHLTRVREAMLLDLGALTFELHRQERQDTALIERKASELAAVDSEARGLAEALDQDAPFSEVIASGIAGTCAQCNAILAADARYCSSCGTAVGSQNGAGRAQAPWASELE